MNTLLKTVLVSAIVVLVVSLGLMMMYGPSATVSRLGTIASGITNFTGISVVTQNGITGKFDVSGSGTGTQFQRLNGGQCYIQPYATTIAATSTDRVDCQATAAVGGIVPAAGVDVALTGVTFGDNVVANLSTTTTGSTVGGLVLEGVSASTTAGYIQLSVLNLTGTTFTWPTTGVATGTASYFVTK